VSPQVVTADLNDDFIEDFEGSFSSWSATGLWHVEDNSFSKYTLDYVPSDSHYAWYGDNQTGNYDTGLTNAGNLTSGFLNFSPFIGNQIYLSFWSWADTETNLGFDLKQVFISTDAGSTWIKLLDLQANPTWMYIALNLTDYLFASSAQIRFSFNTVDNDTNNFRGWLLDDIAIKVGTPLPSGYFDINIDQTTTTSNSDTRELSFTVIPHFNQSLKGNISIVVENPSAYLDTIFAKDNITFWDLAVWTHNHSYKFLEVGHYRVHFSILDEFGRMWYQSNGWEVFEGKLDLWIEQENYALINDERPMTFIIDNQFNTSVNVSMEAYIEYFDEPKELLFSETEIYIGPFTTWERIHYYTFYRTGEYKVLFIVQAFGQDWFADNWWSIDTGDPKIEVGYPEEIKANEPFEVVVHFFSGHHHELHVSSVNITFAENDAHVAGGEYSVDEVLPPETWTNFTLSLTLPDTGEFSLRVTIHTNQGDYEHKFFVKVQDGSNRDSEPNISPGFEAILLLIPLVMLTISQRKKKK
jgi:hypothetical protein